jgi:hypothetical protein
MLDIEESPRRSCVAMAAKIVIASAPPPASMLNVHYFSRDIQFADTAAMKLEKRNKTVK